jgi:uncharacterized membrane protein
MTSTILFLLCMLIGGATGLRSMTGIAVVTLAAQPHWPHLKWLHLTGTGLSFLAHPVSMIVFVLLALGELVADKLPFIPARIQPGPLAARFAFGALCASALALAAGASWIPAAFIGGIAAIVAAYAGYWVRRSISTRGVKDLPIALLEDAAAILLAVFVVSRF